MKYVDLESLPDFLRARRWFGGKAWPIKKVTILDQAILSSGETHSRGTDEYAIGVVEVAYEQGIPERYVLPVAPLNGGGFRDALEDNAFARTLLRFILEGKELPTGSGRLHSRLLPDAKRFAGELHKEPQVRRISAEQSNSSIVFDDRVILKVIRKVEAGLNPEFEIGEFLREKTTYRATPPLLGALEIEGPVMAGMIAVLHEFVPNEGDGWSWVLSRMKEGKIDEVAAAVRELGMRLGELHQALGSAPADDPNFMAEDIHKEDLQRWSASIAGEIGVTVAAAADKVPELMAKRSDLVEEVAALAHLEPSGKKIRLHGDLHLGQVLRTKDGWMIFDFEGEPGRRFDQRREKHSPLKDVAGMLRSFEYAAAAVRLEGVDPKGGPKRLRAAFLEGYLQVMSGTGLLPEGEAALRTVLDILEMEKLLYELRYEVQNRPDWVRIPAGALLQREARPR